MNASTLEIVHFSELEFVAKFALYTVQCVLCSVQCVLCSVNCAVCTVSHVRGLHSAHGATFGLVGPGGRKGILAQEHSHCSCHSPASTCELISAQTHLNG